MPAVPPYSSTTSATWSPARRISDRAASSRLLPGTRCRSLVRSPTVARRAVGSGQKVAQMHEADHVVLRGVYHREPGVASGRGEPGCLGHAETASRKTTSVRGTISSRTWRSPAASTSSMS